MIGKLAILGSLADMIGGTLEDKREDKLLKKYRKYFQDQLGGGHNMMGRPVGKYADMPDELKNSLIKGMLTQTGGIENQGRSGLMEKLLGMGTDLAKGKIQFDTEEKRLDRIEQEKEKERQHKLALAGLFTGGGQQNFGYSLDDEQKRLQDMLNNFGLSIL